MDVPSGSDEARPAPPLSPLERIRRDHPGFDADHRLIEVAVRDCTMAYLWNPIVSAEEFEYDVLGTTMYAGIDDATRTAWVVFRGTDQLIDWVVNLAFLPLPLAHPWAHFGFVAAWKMAKRRFAPWLRAQADRFDQVYISGHSLGGAMAVACAYELQGEGFDVVRCITVGAPRLYIAPSVKQVEARLSGRLIRIVKAKDVVPKVPPEFLGFRHLGAQWDYRSDLPGKGEPQPFPGLMRRLDGVWSAAGRAREWVKKRTGLTVDDQMIAYWLVVIGSVGGAFAWLARSVEISMLALWVVTVAVLVVSGVLVALGAHRSGRYAATRAAASMLEEWQLHHLRSLAAGKTLEPAGDGKVWLDIPTTISRDHSWLRKHRLLRAFRRKFGKEAFNTVVGRSFAAAEVTQFDAKTREAAPVLRLDRKLGAVCVALQLFGYSSEEIDRMIGDGVIRRPAQWTRFYVRLRLAESAPAGERPVQEALTELPQNADDDIFNEKLRDQSL